MLKREMPEAITMLLGIPTIDGIGGPWQSNQDTVIQAWFQAVAELHGLEYDNKVDTMARILEHYGVAWNSSRHSSIDAPKGGGGNLRKEAFADLLEAIRLDPRAARLSEMAATVPFETERSASHSEDEFTLRAIRTRRGQPQFRQALLAAYDYRCAVTECDATPTLEAAHIVRHSEGGDYSTRNGILLRADLHTLFDLGLIGVDPIDCRVLVHPELRATEYSAALMSVRLRLPLKAADHPNSGALQRHNTRFGLS